MTMTMIYTDERQVGNHVLVSAKVDGQPVMRAYTPASGDDERD